jgi:hypothetical protein
MVHMSIRHLIPGCALFLSLAVATPATAQRGENAGCPEPGERRCGAIMKLRPDKARNLFDQLRNGPETEFQALLLEYYGELYSKTFLDWVVFIKKDGTTKQALFANGHFVKDDVVRGQQSLAVIIFAEGDFKPEAPDSAKIQKADSLRGVRLQKIGRRCEAAKVQCTVALNSSGDDAKESGAGGGAGSAGATSGNLLFSRTTLQYTRDPALTAFLKSLTNGLVGPATEPAAVPDSSPPIRLDDVVMHPTEKDSTHLYFSYHRLLLPLNALARFTLRPNLEAQYAFPATTSISRTVENASASRFGASLGLGLTLNTPDSTFAVTDTGRSVVASRSSAVRPRLWVMAHFDIVRPRLPIRPQDLSAFVGTNLSTSDLFRDLLVGLAVDRLFGDVGVVGGLNFIQRQTARPVVGVGGRFVSLQTRDYRRGKAFLGLNFVL